MSSSSKAILRTLVYADIFDYPLTTKEIFRFLISEKSQDFSSFRQMLHRAVSRQDLIMTDGEYFFLRNRAQVVVIRKRRKNWSRPKLRIAHQAGKWLRLVPWIKMVAVTGALAMENSTEDDDIDLLVVTAKNRLWLSRGLIVTILRLFGFYRRPNKVKNMICPNMFLDDGNLCLPKKEQNLFTAHEVCQLKILWGKERVYGKFLRANQWLIGFLPNISKTTLKGERITSSEAKSEEKNNPKRKILDYLENLAYRAQLTYMRPRRTIEVVESGRIRFHPQDCKDWILKEYEKRLENLSR